MSNLLKSKILLGVMIVAVMIVGFAMVAPSTTNAEDTCTLSMTLREKMRNSEVSCLQAKLLVTPATGYFGTITKAAVMAYQANKGLVADGVVGAMTRATLATQTVVVPPTPPVTGCENGALFNPMTGLACTTGTLPAGCVAGALFSSTTGLSCTSTTPVVTNTGEGFLTNVARTGAVNNAKIREGVVDTQVMSIEVTAKDADQTISGLKVNFKNGSLRFTRGAGEVSVWLGSTKIGTKTVSAWSNDTDGYDYRFTGMNGVVTKDTKAMLYVTVSGLSSFDMTDVTGPWTVTVPTDGITAASSNGYYDTYGTAMTSSMTFEKSGSVSSDSKYKVSAAGTNPVATTLRAGLTSDTSDVTLLAFDVKAENSDMVVQKLPVTIAATNGGADGVAPYVEAIAKSVKLYADGVKIADETVTTGAASIVTTFGYTSKLNYTISANKVVKFEVKVDINDVENTGLPASDFDDGDSLTASYTDVNYGGASIVELPNGGNYVQNRSGNATGEAQTFRSTGILATMGTVSTTQNTNQSGFVTSVTYNIPITMKSFEDTVYIGQSASYATTTAGQNALSFVIEDSSAPAVEVLATPAGVGSAVTSTLSSNANISNLGYKLDSGVEKTFTLQVIVTGATVPTAAVNNVRVQLKDLKFFTDNALTAGATIQALSPSTSFETGYKSINHN